MKIREWIYLNGVLPVLQTESARGLSSHIAIHAAREHLPLSEHKRQQLQAIRRIVKHAYSTSPFYRMRLDSAGIDPDLKYGLEDFTRIPVLSRNDIRENFDSLCSTDFRKEDLQIAATSGTTDSPAPLARNRGCLPDKLAVQLRFNMWAGARPGDRTMYFWGARQDLPKHPSWKWKFVEQSLRRRVWAPTAVFNEEILDSYMRLMNKFKPQVIFAYSTPVTLFCEYLLASGKPYHQPKTVICTAEPLHDWQRATIQKALGCKAYQHYGTRDFGLVAAECVRQSGMHVNPAAAFIEQVSIGVDGNLRELLVTDLLNLGMPLLRYRINDCTTAGPEQCDCGCTYPLIQPIIGRTLDNFFLADGSIVPGILLLRVSKQLPGLKQAQVIQHSFDQFEVKFVTTELWSGHEPNVIASKLKSFCGSQIQVRFSQVDEIPREKSGKTRFCISHVRTAQSALETVVGHGGTPS